MVALLASFDDETAGWREREVAANRLGTAQCAGVAL